MKKNIMNNLLGLILCITSALFISTNGASQSTLSEEDFFMVPKEQSNATFGIKNNTNFIINYKYADANDNRRGVEVQTLYPNQTVLMENAPAFLSIKRSEGIGSQWSSYSNLPIADFYLNLNKPLTVRKHKEGLVPAAVIGSSYLNPLGWSLTLEWVRA